MTNTSRSSFQLSIRSPSVHRGHVNKTVTLGNTEVTTGVGNPPWWVSTRKGVSTDPVLDVELQIQPHKCIDLDLLAVILQTPEWDTQTTGRGVIRHNTAPQKGTTQKKGFKPCLFPVIATLHVPWPEGVIQTPSLLSAPYPCPGKGVG